MRRIAALALLAFKNALERLGQLGVERAADDLADHRLTQRLGLNGRMAITIGAGLVPWIALKTKESRQLTESEKTTVCVLGALEHALKRATGRL